jgi:hypothetical protein
MQPDHEHIVERLHIAFPSQPIQSEGAFAARGTTYPDAAAYMQQLAGKCWDELDRAYIVRRSDALGFLGTEHLIAVLPVYLRALVDDGVWSPAAEMLMLILGKPRKEFVRALTDPQRAAIASVLQAFAAQDLEGSLGDAARAAVRIYETRSL